MKWWRPMFVLLLAWPGLVHPAPVRPEGASALVVLIADQHSAYERTAQFVGLVDQLKREDPGLPLAVLIDGDVFEGGNVIARRSAGEIDFAMLAALARRAPTVLNLGNHEAEFHNLADTVRRVEATGVRVVCNIVNRATGRPFTAFSVRLPLGGVEAVVVGLATNDLATYPVAVRPSLELADPVSWAKINFPQLLGRAPLPIVLSHAGLAADRKMLAWAPDGTLFSGAHDHLRLVQNFGRKVYFHSGSWNEFVSLAWLCPNPAGGHRWEVRQVRIDPDGPADPEIAARIRNVRARWLTPGDTEVVGRTRAARSTVEAARLAARALRIGTGADAAFIGNTTFGAGLPAGDVTRLDFNAWIRFDGTIWLAQVTGTRLRKLLAAANQGPDTPFAQRRGEFSFADGPDAIEPGKQYCIATTDWGARNTARYFGEPPIAWREQADLRLKTLVLEGLRAGGP